MAAIVPILAVVAIAIYYLMYAKGGGGQGKVDKHFGLAPGEKSTAFWSAEFATDISLGQQAGSVALGLLAGAMVGGVGIATMRPRGISLVLTSMGRMVMCVENEDSSTSLFAFQSAQVGVQVVGDGGKRMQGGPSLIVRLEGPGQSPIDIRIHESAGPMLTAWAGQRAA